MTAQIIQFPRHRRKRCTDKDDERCCQIDCMLDVLFLCEVCGGGEASLPTHCPGRRMTTVQVDLVQRGTVDFRDGKWRTMSGQDVVWIDDFGM